MLIISRPQTDPYFNIAAEEYLLKNMEQDCFMLWQNQPSIILGKHQNTLAEINFSFVKENSIPVVRRISGGGTVFHDLGNLNFTFISKGKKEKLVNFQKFTQPIIDVLNQMNIPARFEGKNDIRVNGLKISGNAEHVFKNRVLHHGTLLFASDLDFLKRAIKSNPDKFQDKAVQSNRSDVINISDFITNDISISTFKEKIIDHIKIISNTSTEYSLTSTDIEGINRLVNEKYTSWEWNFGYSPAYIFETKLPLYNQTIPIGISVKNGVIENIHLLISNGYDIEYLKRILVGKNHIYDSIQSVIAEHKYLLEQHGIKPGDLIDLMF